MMPAIGSTLLCVLLMIMNKAGTTHGSRVYAG